MPADLDWARFAARDFEQKLHLAGDRRRWATPGELHQILAPGVIQTPALTLIDAELVRLVDTDSHDRLAVFMPPQEGKSERISHAFVLWLLEQNPDLRVAIVSYSDEMARRHGAAIKSDAQTYDGTDGELDLGIRLREDTRAAGRWQIDGHAGGVYCVGVAGSLTGKPVDVLVIDDPLKNLDEAQSQAYRSRAMNFWRGVAVPRLGPGSKVVLVQTRWHQTDMGGQLLSEEPDRWRVVSIPALAESDDDALGRPVGEPMISARGQRDWAGIRRSVGEYVWAALYQQRPAPAEGGLFKRADLARRWRLDDGILHLDGRRYALDDCWRFLTVDLAGSTRTSADFTVAAVWAITLGGELVLLDGRRERVDPSGHAGLVDGLRRTWAADTVFVESRMLGTTLVYELGRAGVPTSELKPDKDKFTRALPAAARAESGLLWLPDPVRAPWITDWVDELVAFPNAAHDDVVDVVAYAARVVAAHWLGPDSAEVEQTRAAVPDDGFVDLMRVAW